MEIIIDIKNGIKTNAFKLENMLHYKAFLATLNKISEYIMDYEYHPRKEIKRIHHKTITIRGERGAGKTSFILTIKKYLKNKNNFKFESILKVIESDEKLFYNYKIDRELDKKVCFLKILDPTLVTTKQNILLHIIGMISEEIEKYNTHRIEYDYYNTKENETEYTEWIKSKRELAKGLNQLDNIGNNPYSSEIWDDNDIILEKGLELDRHGFNS